MTILHYLSWNDASFPVFVALSQIDYNNIKNLFESATRILSDNIATRSISKVILYNNTYSAQSYWKLLLHTCTCNLLSYSANSYESISALTSLLTWNYWSVSCACSFLRHKIDKENAIETIVFHIEGNALHLTKYAERNSLICHHLPHLFEQKVALRKLYQIKRKLQRSSTEPLTFHTTYHKLSVICWPHWFE